jgi:hypothetical protein
MTIVSDAVTWRVRDDWRERMGQSSLAALESAGARSPHPMS